MWANIFDVFWIYEGGRLPRPANFGLVEKEVTASISQCLLQFVYHAHMLHFAAQRIWLAQSCKGCVVGGTCFPLHPTMTYL